MEPNSVLKLNQRVNLKPNLTLNLRAKKKCEMHLVGGNVDFRFFFPPSVKLWVYIYGTFSFRTELGSAVDHVLKVWVQDELRERIG